MNRRPGRSALAVLVAAGLALAPSDAPAQDTVPVPDTVLVADTTGRDTLGAAGAGTFFGRSYAVLAYDSASGQLGLAAASTEFSVASGGAYLEPGTGAVAVQGQGGGGAGRRILASLRSGRNPTAALRAASGRGAAVQAAALTPACDPAAWRVPGVEDEAASRPGRSGGTCYIALGIRLRSSTSMDRLVRSFRSSTGSLAERLLATLSAMEGAVQNVGGSRSAVLWVAAGDTAGEILGRRELRLQVEDHERPALALEKHLEAGRGEWLAGRASRAIDRGDYRQAAALADSSLTLDVSSPVAWLQRGRALLYMGREDAAETAFRRMLELDPFLLRLLGDASGSEITVRESVIPYYPRVVLRLDLYRREYFDGIGFGPQPRPFGPDSVPADTAG